MPVKRSIEAPPGFLGCTICRQIKPESEFHKQRRGKSSRCSQCKRAENRAIRERQRGEPDLTAPERFWKKVQKTAGCWLWTGSKKEDGYGFFVYQGRCTRAHRVALILSGVDVPPYDGGSYAGTVVDHICGNVSCVRPDHLRLVRQSDNIHKYARRIPRTPRNETGGSMKPGYDELVRYAVALENAAHDALGFADGIASTTGNTFAARIADHLRTALTNDPAQPALGSLSSPQLCDCDPEGTCGHPGDRNYRCVKEAIDRGDPDVVDSRHQSNSKPEGE